MATAASSMHRKETYNKSCSYTVREDLPGWEMFDNSRKEPSESDKALKDVLSEVGFHGRGSVENISNYVVAAGGTESQIRTLTKFIIISTVSDT